MNFYNLVPLQPFVRVGDIMNIKGGLLCYDYAWHLVILCLLEAKAMLCVYFQAVNLVMGVSLMMQVTLDQQLLGGQKEWRGSENSY